MKRNSSDHSIGVRPEQKRFKTVPRFNPKNRIITAKEVEDIINGVFQKMNHQSCRKTPIDYISITDVSPFIHAFTHSSYQIEMMELQKQSTTPNSFFIPEKNYQILEFHGDAILSSIIVNTLVDNFGDYNENFLTTLKIRLVKKKRYADFSKYLGFQEYILISSFLEKSKGRGRYSDSMLEDVFEAFIGAIVEHFGFKVGTGIAYDFVNGIIEETINWTKLIMTPDNFKDAAIQHYRLANWGKQPPFERLYQHGPPNNRTFGIILKLQKEYVFALEQQRREKIIGYNRDICELIPREHMTTEIQERVGEICDSEYFIIGLAVAPSIREGEQQASKIGLEFIGVDPNFTLLNGSHDNNINLMNKKHLS